MLYHYTYEYGWVDGDQALHVYHSRDGRIGLAIRSTRVDGVWDEGVTGFFLTDRQAAEYPSMAEARAALDDCIPGRPAG